MTLVGLQSATATDVLRQAALRELTLVGPNAHVFGADFVTARDLVAARRDWTVVAPYVRPLADLPTLFTSGPNDERPPIKTLFDPRVSSREPARY